MQKQIIFHTVILFVIAHSLFPVISFSQVKWQKNPLEQKVFIENKGQLDEKSNGGKGKILFSALQQGVKMYWSAKGLTYKVTEHYISEEAKREAKEEMKKGGDPDAMMEKMQVRFHYLNMEWVGANPNAGIISEEPVSNYFTYANPNDKSGKSGIKASAYKKITYKNIYPDIDAEYILPEKGGIKYSLIVHPGADASVIKMRYSGAEKINLNSSGEVEIKSNQCGNYLEHRPATYYEGGIPVNSMFSMQSNNTIGFNLAAYDKTKTLIIDPWVSIVSFLSNPGPYTPYGNVGYDVSYDLSGNVWVYGGGDPLYLAKYNNAGTLLWTYAIPFPDFSNLLGDFEVNKASGTAYISEGCNTTSGANLVKVNSQGMQTALFPGSGSVYEIPRIRLDCSGRLYTACAGINNGGYQIGMMDTNMVALTGSHFFPTMEGDHDQALMTLDPSGNFMYMNFNFPASQGILHNNEMRKVAIPSFTPAAVLNAGPIHNFKELHSMSYAGRDGWGNYWNIDEWRLNTFNGMVCGNCFLYTYNGDTLKKWDKNTGAMLAQVRTGGKAYWSGGLDMDRGENLYAGVGNKVKEYDPNLNLINTYNLPDTSCYDLKVDNIRNLVYACGNKYVCAIAVTTSPPPTLTVTTSFTPAICTCNGTASINITGGCITASSFSYNWMPGGQTTQAATGLCPGTYTVTVSASNCIPLLFDTVTVPGSTVLSTTVTAASAVCGNNGSASVNIISGNAPYTYNWNPSGQTTAHATGLGAGTYSVIVTDGNGCTKSDTVSVVSTGSIIATANSTTLCSGQNATLTASGGTNYSWSTGATTSSITPIATAAATYSVIVSSGSCVDTAYASVAVTPSPSVSLGNNQTLCSGQSISLDAGNSGAGYLWSTGATTQTITVTGAGTYWVFVALNNCVAKDTVSTFIAPKVHLFDSSLCTTSPIVLDPGGGATSYLWSNGSTTQTISVDVSGNYWVVAIFGNCMSSDSSKITGDGTGGTIYIPNCFTPNDDNINEIFLAKGTGIATFDMSIFDRWGNLIFTSDDVYKGWDGRVQGGHYPLKKDGSEISQEDVYVWKIDYTMQCFPNQVKKDMGRVTIVK